MNLIIDADDTLWENNIYFERAFDGFCEFLAHSHLNPAEVRTVLDEIESANNKIHGYGSLNFGRNLVECYRKLSQRHIAEEDLRTVMSYAEQILECPMEVIDGVEETLAYLTDRHDLTLFTKGHSEEQRLKLDRSGLSRYFQHTAIVKEKDAAAYRKLVRERGMEPAQTWMIGNSPKSDINAALAAGLNAVFVPHARTWTLEHEQIIEAPPERLVSVNGFRELRNYF